LRDEHEALVKAGVSVLAIGGSAEYQAAALQPDYPFPLLLDPDQIVRAAVGLGTLSIRDMMRPSGAWRYVRALRSRAAPGKITKDREQAPGVVLTDATLDVVWVHRGEGLGDYPTTETVRDQIARVQ
jgi:hypothetical protein